MAERPREPTPHFPGWLVWYLAAVGLLMLYKAVGWWVRWAAGDPPVSGMTGGQWAEVAFYHATLVCCAVVVIGWFRERARARRAELPVAR